MPITWKSVDLPESISKAANMYQQSIKDMASSFNNVAGSFVDMQSNEATANLEARLAKEQELAQVDAMAQMDANQLRQNTSNWIDPTKAREMIKGRQIGLEQETVGNFNELLAAGDLTGASATLDTLASRQGFDASGLTKQLEGAKWESALTSNPEAAFDSAKTIEQKQQAGLLAYNNAMKNGLWEKASLYAATPEQANEIKMGRNTELVNKAFPRLAKELSTATVDKLPAILKQMDDELYTKGYDVETISTLSGALAGLRQNAVQKMMDSVNVAPEAKEFVNQQIPKLREEVDAVFKPETEQLYAKMAKVGITPIDLKLFSEIKDVDALNREATFSDPTAFEALDKIIALGNFNDSYFFGKSFNAKELFNRMKQNNVDISGLTYGDVAMAVMGGDYNTMSLTLTSDADEMDALKTRLNEARTNKTSRNSDILKFSGELQSLEQRKKEMEYKAQSELIKNARNFTVSSVSSSGGILPQEAYINLNANKVVGEISGNTIKEQAAIFKQMQQESNKEVTRLGDELAKANKALEEAQARLNTPKPSVIPNNPTTTEGFGRSRARILSKSEIDAYTAQKEETEKAKERMMKAEFEQLRNKPKHTKEEAERLMYLLQRVGM